VAKLVYGVMRDVLHPFYSPISMQSDLPVGLGKI